MHAKYVHTNIIARDWRKLVDFYEQVFGCVPVPPERDLSGQWIDDVTGIPGARIQGIHLRLPGCGDEGPTLEIFQYSPHMEAIGTVINRPGLRHIAFAVDDIESARDDVIAAGGGEIGKIVQREIPVAGTVKFVYLTDPEGNIIELQRWSQVPSKPKKSI